MSMHTFHRSAVPDHARRMAALTRRLAGGLVGGVALAFLAGAAQAGRSCEARPPTPSGIERGLTLAERTMAALDAEHHRSGARVVVLARAGQDLRKYGLQYSHLGLAWRLHDGRWRVLHKLNHCATAEASVYLQGLGEFFLDEPWRHEAAWLVPTPEVQARLLAWLDAGSPSARRAGLHHKPYSVVSYAWGQRYQQSNQWLIESLAQAMEPGIHTREAAQAWLMFKAYEPAILRLGPLTRLGGRVGAANVAFDDHPAHKRFSDRIETVSAESVLAWLGRAGLAAGPLATLAL